MTAAAGGISLAEEALRITLADCATFRAWVGATTPTQEQAQARGRVHREALPPRSSRGEYTLEELAALRPYALIGTVDFRVARIGAPANRRDGGTLELKLVQDVPREIAKNVGEIGRRFMNTVGAVIDELMALYGGATSANEPYLSIEEIEMPEPWFRMSDDDKTEADNEPIGDAVGVDLLLRWGGAA